MTKEYQELLTRGLTIVKEWEFSEIPNEDEIEHIFSDKYLKSKQKLLNKLGHSYWKYVNTISKKVAIIIVTFIIAFSSLMTVASIREKVVDFIVNVYKTFSEIIPSNSNEKTSMSKYYSIPNFPENYNYIELSVNQYDGMIATYWIIEQQKYVMLTQISTSDPYKFDSENGELSELIINNTPCLVCKTGTDFFCYWEFDGYRFELVYPIDLGEEFMSEVVGKLVEIDPEDMQN